MRTISERHLQAIWYDQKLRPDDLHTIDGDSAQVLDPGTWNLEAGPDFLGAKLKVGGLHVSGDAEMHLHPSDWTNHRHAGDPAYAHVAVHVTWFHAPPPPDLPCGCLTICLGDSFRDAPTFSADEIDLGVYPYARMPTGPRPCTGRFGTDAMLAFLREAGETRLRLKAERLAARLALGGDPFQVFCGELLAAFGYKHNSAPFRALAAALPWSDLPPEREALRHCLECVSQMRVLPTIPWRRANVRPANSPERRLDSVAVLLEKGRDLKQAFDDLDLATRKGQRIALGILGEAGVGQRRGAAILANLLVPFAIAEGRLKRFPERLFAEDVNSIVRMTAMRLFGTDHNQALYASNGLLIQGLIHVHHVHCLAARADCSNCGLVRSMDQRKENVTS